MQPSKPVGLESLEQPSKPVGLESSEQPSKPVELESLEQPSKPVGLESPEKAHWVEGSEFFVESSLLLCRKRKSPLLAFSP